jgi:hypothetical protein
MVTVLVVRRPAGPVHIPAASPVLGDAFDLEAIARA